MTREAHGAVILPGEGRRIPVGPNHLTVKVGAETGSRLVGIFESELPSGGGFPFGHVHAEYEEVFYVLEGHINYLLGDTWTAAGAGSTVFVPPGVVHAFRNASRRPARHLVVHAPVEALAMIEEVGSAAPHELAAVLEKYRSRLVDDVSDAGRFLRRDS
jgi:quercetin dioxygenase-like cupin family protein